MAKTIKKPTKREVNPPTDDAIASFVTGGSGKDTETQKNRKMEKHESVEMARLTVDLPKAAHRRFKSACAISDVKMNDEIRQFIERRTAELEADKS